VEDADPSAPVRLARRTVRPFRLDELDEVVRSFGGREIYGWEFFDVADAKLYNRWKGQPSLDWQSGDGRGSHTLDLFQGELFQPKSLEVRLWFDSLDVADEWGEPIPIAKFIEGGVGFWDAASAGKLRDTSLLDAPSTKPPRR
jgi:hypothetical protein